MTDLKRQCLIADDVRAWRELLNAWLIECDYEPILVNDGVEAQQAFDERLPSLVITDIEMPKCSGLELLGRIRHHRLPEMRSVPVIVISSLCEDELGDIVRNFGGNCVLTKPLERVRVMSAVKHLEDGKASDSMLTHNPGEIQSNSSKTISPKLRRLAEEALMKCETEP